MAELKNLSVKARKLIESEGIKKIGPYLYQAISKSDPHNSHIIMLENTETDDVGWCDNCTGWKYNRKCYHMEAALYLEEQGK